MAAAKTHDVAALLEAAVQALGGAPRAGQQKMAQAVAQALRKERHLAVQAGTGTGKSLAYLVPAIAHAVATDSTVIISTATIALQQRLVGSDLPLLAQALEPVLGHKPTFAIFKGRGNYVCLNRLSQEGYEPVDPVSAASQAEGPARQAPRSTDAAAEGTGSAAGDSDAGAGASGLFEKKDVSRTYAMVKRVAEWCESSETGDRDQLDPGVPNEVWSKVSVSSRECLGASRCHFGSVCFAERAKQQARSVHIVVTNHTMLAIDAMSDAEILPEHSAIIVDEAHELDSRITNAATSTLSPTALNLAASRATALGAEEKEVRLKELADGWKQESLPVGRWTEMDQPRSGFLKALKDALWAVKEAVGRAPADEAQQDPVKHGERLSLVNHLLELHDAIVRILQVFDTENPAEYDDVVWLNHSELAGDSLNVAPLAIEGLLSARLFAKNTVVLTSATLTIGGNFNAMAAQWGLPAGSWDSLDAGTPFDPAKAGILYVAQHLPEPGRDGLAEQTVKEMQELIMAAGGRTLGLFSSRRAAEQAAQALRLRLPFDVYVQGEDSTSVLVRKFSKEENSVLLGTLSLWQGVDVPGKSCSLVLIDRIPFPRPDDPLMQARKEAADAQRGNGFMAVSATHAALLMAQGAGRLLRHTTDRGVVAVLDSRMATKRYGSFFRNSLPPFWYTTSPETVRGALQRVVASD